MTEKNWFEMENIEPYMEQAWQNRVNGEVLSLEKVGPDTFTVVTLPENFKDDNQPIKELAREKSRSMATGTALGYIRNGEA